MNADSVCEVCLEPLRRAADLDKDGYTEPADCCDRVGLCCHCRQRGNHDCDGRDGPHGGFVPLVPKPPPPPVRINRPLLPTPTVSRIGFFKYVEDVPT